MTDTQNQTPDNAPQKKSYTLWILVAIFVLPVILAYTYYFTGDNFSLSNHGELLNPVVQFDSLNLKTANGDVFNRDSTVWMMLTIAGNNCDDNCKQALYYMRQINIALGKNQDRFRHLVIHDSNMSDTFAKFVADEHASLLNAYATKNSIQSLIKSGTTDQDYPIYVVDPLGNIMMRFKPGTDPKLILKDLNRLLKISRIG